MKLKNNIDEELAAFAYKQVAARHHPAQRVYLRILLKKLSLPEAAATTCYLGFNFIL